MVGKEAPPESMLEDLDEREQHAWWKAKKWAYSNLNRLFARLVDRVWIGCDMSDNG